MMMPAAVVSALSLSQKKPLDLLGSALGGIPRGALTEITGPASAGRTSLLYSLLAQATWGSELCAFIDVDNRFDPASASAAGVRLPQVLWIRCGGSVEHALKAMDLLAQAGGFGLIALDLADTPLKLARAIPLAAWFRLRSAVENTRTALAVLSSSVHASSSSALKIQLAREKTAWNGNAPARLLEGFHSTAVRIRNHQPEPAQLCVTAR